MAYKVSIVFACPNRRCGGKPAYWLVRNNRNAEMGTYCLECAVALVRQLDKDEAKAAEAEKRARRDGRPVSP